jgi:hypothetical protein
MNAALHTFASIFWPEVKEAKSIQKMIHYFIYNELSSLFLTLNDYNQYWIMSTGNQHFEALDTEPEVTWSGRKEMQQGDLVFMYRQTPRKAITDIYEVTEDPWFDPFGGWKGFWVPLKKITQIKDITYADMKQDEILKNWNFVIMPLGVSTAPIPYFVYNRLLDLIDKDIKEKHKLQPEKTIAPTTTKQYATEKEFEDDVIEPLLKRSGLKYQRQQSCDFFVGSQHHVCQLDFLVMDNNKNELTLFENKIRIADDQELAKAVLQAKSYSLQLGLEGFVIASPEGFWIYKLDRNKEIQIGKISIDKTEEIKPLILKFKAS